MSFLSLFALFGLGLGALPILFHLKKQNVKEHQSISSLMFLKATAVPQKQSRKMDNWLLLLLRLLALCCIVFAFSRPVWLSNLILEQGLQKEMMTWVVDSSASMNRGEVQKKLEQAYQIEKEKLQSNDYFELISFSNQPKVIISYEQWERTPESSRLQLLEEQWLKITPSENSTQMSSCLLFAEQRQTQTWTQYDDFKKLVKKRLVVFSDLTENQSLEGLEQLKQSEGVETSFHHLNPKVHWNARPFFKHHHKPGHAPQLGVHFVHGQDQQNLNLKLQVNQKTVYSTSLTCLPEEIELLPWPAEVPFQADEAYHLIAEGDEETFDNSAYYISRQPDHLDLVHYAEKNDSIHNSRFFIETGLKSDPTLHINFHSSVSNLKINHKPFFIIEKDLPQDELQKLISFVEQGASTFIMMTPSISSEFISTLFEQTLQIIPQDHIQGMGIKRVDIKAPLFQPFSDPRFRDFSAIHFWKSFNIKGWDRDATFSNLIQLDSDQPLLLEQNKSKGKLWLMTSNLSADYGNFARSSKFLPFLFSLIDQSLSRQSFQASYRVGESFISPFEDHELNQLKRVVGQSTTKDTFLPEGYTMKSGIYKLQQSSENFSYCVNLSESESNTRSMDPSQINYLKSFNGPTSNKTNQTQEPMQRKTKFLSQLEAQQKLWQNFLLAAFIFVALETALAAVNSKFNNRRVQT